MNTADPREELGHFLYERRTSLTREDVGLPPTSSRRRTPGLRREEVAERAEIGPSLYTRIEQGCHIGVSRGVWERIAWALKLDYAAKAHLFQLAGIVLRTDPTPMEEQVSPALQLVLDNQDWRPAYVMGRRWDMIGWNQATCRVYGDVSVLSRLERNVLSLMFTNPAIPEVIVDWEQHAQRVLRQFRLRYWQYAGDPDFEELIAFLTSRSSLFETWWWHQHTVDLKAAIRKEINHPVAGYLVMEQTGYPVANEPDLLLVLHMALNDETAQRLQRLCAPDILAPDVVMHHAPAGEMPVNGKWPGSSM